MRRLASVVLAALILAPASAAWAGEPEVQAEAPEPTIFGGEPTATCGWPSTVSMAGNCSGTLVHPEIVIFAAHCPDVDWVFFGEDVTQQASGRVVDTEYCDANPDWTGLGQGTDFHFCKLAEPVTEVEIVPILMGCELDLLQPGAEVVAVGFGFDENDGYGVKRAVNLPLVSVDLDTEVEAGGMGESICNGDSGGPLYIRLPPELDPEQSWRVFGVTSWGPPDCNDPQYFGLMHNAVAWIENRSGVDITPCHNADGSWQAGPDCGAFPLDPAAGAGAWGQWCEAQPLGGPSTSCGEASVADDVEAPSVAIVSPADQQEFSTSILDGGLAEIEILGEAADVGWGVASVELLIDGGGIPNGVRSFPPWRWTANFPKGGYSLQLIAIDHGGNEAASEIVYIGVDEPAPEPPEPMDTGDTGDTGDLGTGGDEVGESGGLGADAGVGDEGCACSIDGRRRGGFGGALLVLGLGFGLGMGRRATRGR